tara:strand:- start:13104 stop:13298 length:195 start_codon:yes stop_codon:yes gene_type:complete
MINKVKYGAGVPGWGPAALFLRGLCWFALFRRLVRGRAGRKSSRRGKGNDGSREYEQSDEFTHE